MCRSNRYIFLLISLIWCRQKNIKLLQNNTDEDLAEPIPDIMPTYQTQFINGFINKIQKSNDDIIILMDGKHSEDEICVEKGIDLEILKKKYNENNNLGSKHLEKKNRYRKILNNSEIHINKK